MQDSLATEMREVISSLTVVVLGEMAIVKSRSNPK